MSQKEIKDAVAEQEEYIKRRQSCGGPGTFRAHAFRQHGRPSVADPWSQCLVCGVTETPKDYQIKTGGNP